MRKKNPGKNFCFIHNVSISPLRSYSSPYQTLSRENILSLYLPSFPTSHARRDIDKAEFSIGSTTFSRDILAVHHDRVSCSRPVVSICHSLPMANLTCLLLSPILLLVSIPLTIFAAFTSALAFSTLSVHVIIVYAELAAVLIRNQFSDAAVSPSTTTFFLKNFLPQRLIST